MIPEEDMLIERFLKQELSKSEAEAFQKRLHYDAELREKVNFEKQLFETLNEETWSYAETAASEELKAYESLFKSGEAKTIQKIILEVNDKYQSQHRQKNKRRWIFYPVAAAITLMLVIYGLEPRNKSPESLYTIYLDKSNLPFFSTRGDDNINLDLLNAQSLINDQAYIEAEPILLKVLASGYESGAVYINLAIAQMRMENFDVAEATLNKLITSDLLDAEKGYWFKGLMYIGSGEIDKGKAILNSIISNSYFNHEISKELLKKLD